MTVQVSDPSFSNGLGGFQVCLSGVAGDRSGVRSYVFKWFGWFSGVAEPGAYNIFKWPLNRPPASLAAAPTGNPTDRILVRDFSLLARLRERDLAEMPYPSSVREQKSMHSKTHTLGRKCVIPPTVVLAK